MYEQLQFKVEGVAPILMHNGRTADPLDPMTKLLKSVTGKKKKTDQDHEILAKLEFLAGACVDKPINVELQGYNLAFECNGQFCIPSENWERALIEGSMKIKLGRQAKAALFVEKDATLIGAPSVQAAFKNPNEHFYTRRVKVQQSCVMRTRPIFRRWACVLDVSYLPNVLNETDVREIARLAGQLVGVMDYRPRFGRFQLN